MNPMADPSHASNGQILTLPWNRLPNYLICVVTLVNLVTGIVALLIAIGFTAGMSSFEEWVAATSIGIFGVMLIWGGWCFRRGVLPVQFVADAGRRECGFRWKRWWNGRVDLADAEQLIGELRFAHQNWHWVILACGSSAGRANQFVYGTGSRFEEEGEARGDCEKVLRQLAEHLSLPFELRTRAEPNS